MADVVFSDAQLLAYNEFLNPQSTRILYGGGAGGGKSFFICLIVALMSRKYAGIRIGLARKELMSLRQTTLSTLLSKVHPALGITQDDYTINGRENFLEYRNGSRVQFLDLTAKPSDPDFESLGSLELTIALVDEAGETDKRAVDVLSSRVGRWMNREFGLVGTTLLACNPSTNWLRQEFYDPYEKRGMGPVQKWENGQVWVDGVKVPAYDVYIRATVTSNPFIDPNYIENLKKLPPQERKRLLDGDWNYLDDDDSLFPMKLLDKATTFEADLDEPVDEKFNKAIGVDLSDSGKDATIAVLVENGVGVKAIEIKSPKGSDQAIGYAIAEKLIDFAMKNGFTPAVAKYITIEGNGVGASARDALRAKGWKVNVYIATQQTRSDGFYNLMLDLDAGRMKLLEGSKDFNISEIKKELIAHTYDLDTGKTRVVKKSILRKKIGRSPDWADAMMIANMAYNAFKPKPVGAYIRW